MDLFLVAVEKFVNTPKAFIAVALACLMIFIGLSSYKKHVARVIYFDKDIIRVNSKYLRRMLIMFGPLSVMVHLILSYSNYLHNDYTNQPFLFIQYSIPLFALTTFQNIAIIMREEKIPMGKAIVAVIPGSSFYILFYCFLGAAYSSVWLLVIIAILGIVTPNLLNVAIVICLSEKSKVKVKIYTDDGDIYDINKKDLIEGTKEITLKLRDMNGKVNQSIFINNDKITKKEYYRVERD